MLPGGKIGFFQRLFLCGQPVGQGGQGVGGQVCQLLPGGNLLAVLRRSGFAAGQKLADLTPCLLYTSRCV